MHEKLVTVGFSDGFYVMPSVWDGEEQKDMDLIVRRSMASGFMWGPFKNQQEADSFAIQRSKATTKEPPPRPKNKDRY